MKKLFPIAVIAVVAFLFTSCSKTYTCTCKISGYGVKDSMVYFTYHGVTNNTASNNCNNQEASGNTTGYTYSCHL